METGLWPHGDPVRNPIPGKILIPGAIHNGRILGSFHQDFGSDSKVVIVETVVTLVGQTNGEMDLVKGYNRESEIPMCYTLPGASLPRRTWKQNVLAFIRSYTL